MRGILQICLSANKLPLAPPLINNASVRCSFSAVKIENAINYSCCRPLTAPAIVPKPESCFIVSIPSGHLFFTVSMGKSSMSVTKAESAPSPHCQAPAPATHLSSRGATEVDGDGSKHGTLRRDQGRVLAGTESGRCSSWIRCSCAAHRNILPREAAGFSYSIHHPRGKEEEKKYLTADSSSRVRKNALSFGDTRILLPVKRLKNKSVDVSRRGAGTHPGCSEEPPVISPHSQSHCFQVRLVFTHASLRKSAAQVRTLNFFHKIPMTLQRWPLARLCRRSRQDSTADYVVCPVSRQNSRSNPDSDSEVLCHFLDSASENSKNSSTNGLWMRLPHLVLAQSHATL